MLQALVQVHIFSISLEDAVSAENYFLLEIFQSVRDARYTHIARR